MSSSSEPSARRIAASPDDEPVASPCISICKMDPRAGSDEDRAAGGLCVGCLRTLDEIVEWGTASEARKHAILATVRTRSPV